MDKIYVNVGNKYVPEWEVVSQTGIESNNLSCAFYCENDSRLFPILDKLAFEQQPNVEMQFKRGDAGLITRRAYIQIDSIGGCGDGLSSIEFTANWIFT